MKRTILILAALTALTARVTPLYAETEILNSDTGVVRVFVANEDGTPAVRAPIYLTDNQGTLHMAQSDELGAISIDLQEGTYAVSSAQMRQIEDSNDRYTSSVATIQVLPKDTTTVVLTLHLADDAITSLSLSALKKIGVADEVAKYLN